LENAASTLGWTVQVVRAGETFARLVVHGQNETVVVDLAVDSAPERPATITLAGPSLDPQELAGRKVIALFDRAEARDFADVYVLAARYGSGRLLELAASVDRGFDIAIFATMLDFLDRFSDDEIPAPAADIQPLRTFFAGWSRRLHEDEGQ
jgi:predicted nucleotidyltransferase component of viral defense system